MNGDGYFNSNCVFKGFFKLHIDIPIFREIRVRLPYVLENLTQRIILGGTLSTGIVRSDSSIVLKRIVIPLNKRVRNPTKHIGRQIKLFNISLLEYSHFTERIKEICQLLLIEIPKEQRSSEAAENIVDLA